VWTGHFLVLIVLLSQYTQGLVLLTRRIISRTHAAVDTAILAVLVAGTVGLLRSLLLLLNNSRWTLSADDFQPCPKEPCGLDECRDRAAQQHELPGARLQGARFGSPDVFAYMEWLMFSIVGANLLRLVTLMLATQDLTVPLWEEVMLTLLLHCIWMPGFSFLVRASSFHGIERLSLLDPISGPHVGNVVVLEDIPGPSTMGRPGGGLPRPATTSAEQRESLSALLVMWIRLRVAVPLHGIFLVLVGIGALLLLVLLLVMPSVALLIQAVGESSAWAGWDPGQPCSQLWKDELEDLLWWV